MLPLTENWRSRPEVLAVVNQLFAATFGDEFQRLVAAGRFPDPASGPAVELLVTDKSSYKDTGVPWRRGEARAIARRVKELVDAGEAEAGEIVLLFAAGTDAEQYEEELRAAGLPTYRATGRGYFGQQQVVDMLGYLRLLHNRYDDEALLTVLASPFVGVSNDGLVAVRRAATKRPLFAGLERGIPEGASERDARLLQAFRQRYDRLAAIAGTVGLERLCEHILVEHDYDLAVLAQWDGRRRYANLRKLARLARLYEELRGPDVEGFVRFVLEQDAAGVKELEAVAEEEGAGAVRLLTIHAAKGLEFKVVVVADAGRDRPPTSGEEIICLPDGRFGFKVVNPLTGRREGAYGYDEVREVEEAAEEAERLRLYYVAMTRAIDRLIVAGSVDGEKRDAKTPMGWVLDRLELDELEDGEVERGEARLRIAVDRYAPEAVEVAPAVEEDDQLSLFDAERRRDRRRGAGARPARARRGAAGRARAAALVHGARAVRELPVPLLRRAHRRHAPRRRARARPRPDRDGGHRDRQRRPPAARGHRPGEPRAAVARGGRGVVPRCDRGGARTDRRARRGVLRVAARRTAGGARGRDGRAAVRVRADGVLFHGFLDVLHRDGGRALVADYKSNAIGDHSPAEIVEAEYRLQRLVYAIACFRAGAERSRSSTSSSSGPTRWSRPSSGASSCPSSRPSSPRRSPGSRRAGSRRGRASGPAPGARRSTWSAPGTRHMLPLAAAFLDPGDRRGGLRPRAAAAARAGRRPRRARRAARGTGGRPRPRPPGAEAGDRVHEALQPVLGLDDLGRRKWSPIAFEFSRRRVSAAVEDVGKPWKGRRRARTRTGRSTVTPSSAPQPSGERRCAVGLDEPPPIGRG